MYSTQCPMYYEVFQADWWEQALFLVLTEHKCCFFQSFRVILFLALGYFPPTHAIISTQLNTPGGPSTNLWCYLCMHLSHLWHSFTQTLAVLFSPDSQLLDPHQGFHQVPSEILISVLLPRNPLKALTRVTIAPHHLFNVHQGSLCFIAWLMASVFKNLHILSSFFGCFSQQSKSGPFSSILARDRMVLFIDFYWGFYLTNVKLDHLFRSIKAISGPPNFQCIFFTTHLYQYKIIFLMSIKNILFLFKKSCTLNQSDSVRVWKTVTNISVIFI